MSKIYEAMFLLDSGYASAHWDQAVKDMQDMMSRHGCEIIRMVKWDDRKLAYEIEHHKRGAYLLIYFTGPGLSVGRIERDVQLSETILRVLILKHEKMTNEDALRMPIPSREKNIIGEEMAPLEIIRSSDDDSEVPMRGGRGRREEAAVSDDEISVGDEEV